MIIGASEEVSRCAQVVMNYNPETKQYQPVFIGHARIGDEFLIIGIMAALERNSIKPPMLVINTEDYTEGAYGNAFGTEEGRRQ